MRGIYRSKGPCCTLPFNLFRNDVANTLTELTRLDNSARKVQDPDKYPRGIRHSGAKHPMQCNERILPLLQSHRTSPALPPQDSSYQAQGGSNLTCLGRKLSRNWKSTSHCPPLSTRITFHHSTSSTLHNRRLAVCSRYPGIRQSPCT